MSSSTLGLKFAPLLRSLPSRSQLYMPSSSTSLFHSSSPIITKSSSSPFTATTHHRSISTTTAKMSATPYLTALAARRSIYPLKKESPIPDSRLREIITEVIKHVPSSFNAQSTRAVLLLHAEHDKLWDIHAEVLKPIVPAEGWAATEGKINMFKGAYATVRPPPLTFPLPPLFHKTVKLIIPPQILFFTHAPTIVGQQKAFPMYAEKFPHWAAQSSGAHEISLWTALAAEGLGGNLQHYNPLVDARVRETWGISEDWVLDAELVVGTPAGEAGEKAFLPIEGERLLVFGEKA